jgi:hypothetical protein
MEAAKSSEMLISYRYTTRCDIPEDLNLNFSLHIFPTTFTSARLSHYPRLVAWTLPVQTPRTSWAINWTPLAS